MDDTWIWEGLGRPRQNRVGDIASTQLADRTGTTAEAIARRILKLRSPLRTDIDRKCSLKPWVRSNQED
jgi:hypothetical protein